MTPDHLLGGLIGLLFLYSSSFKIVTTKPLQRTLTELGLPEGLAEFVAKAVPVYELALAAAVVGLAPRLLAVLLVGVAAAAIGAAGVVALFKPTSIACSCFSASSSSTLGWRQILVAGGLFASALALAWLGDDPRGDLRMSLLGLTVVSLVAIVCHLVTSLGVVTASIGYRRAASVEYPA